MPYQYGLADAIRIAGLKYVISSGWSSRGSETFNPRGVVCHHTGPWSTVSGMVNLCINGYEGLPGPLANCVLSPNGVVYLIAAGRANHAGTGGWKGLTGNSSVFGIEAIHSGSKTTPWPSVQLEAYYKLCAAMACMKAFSSAYVCGHKEWAPTRKIDPISLDMNAFRAKVQAYIDNKPVQPLPPGTIVSNAPLVAVLHHSTWGEGYIQVAADGGTFSHNAPNYGSLPGIGVTVNNIVDAEVTPTGKGYTMTGRDGAIYNFGDSRYKGRVFYSGQ